VADCFETVAVLTVALNQVSELAALMVPVQRQTGTFKLNGSRDAIADVENRVEDEAGPTCRAMAAMCPLAKECPAREVALVLRWAVS
jgi:hypothetical protein